ncbi:sialic acid-binding Ig-like lectin 10 [Sorex araneus]|uniref:sialic acid-binding Ig-like lectin 10 n=1 Tax=Sorex araneus TaxID=42254 RepID=UPI002433B344|nr:sialic acid-binding Ig-like lectin 10 [Sorex araneus]
MVLLLLLAMLWGGSQAQDARYELHMQRAVTLQKGLCALLPCTVNYPQTDWTQETRACGFWYRVGPPKSLVATNCSPENVHHSTKGRFQLLGQPKDWSCSLLITDVQESDRGVYYFRVERGPTVVYSYLNDQLSLEVNALTQKPDIYILEPLWPGHRATVICVFNTFAECPAPTFSWEGAAVSSRRTQAGTHMSSVLTLEPRPQDHSTDLTCRVRFAPSGLSTEKKLRLEVAYAPKDLVISVSRAKGAAPQLQERDSPLQARKGQFLQLLCEADSLPHATLTWALEGRVVSCSRPQGPEALALVLPAVTEGDAGTYTCRAENPLGSQIRRLHLVVQFEETSSKTASFWVLQGRSLQLLCVAHSNPPANISWAWGPLAPNPVQSQVPGLLLLPGVQPDQEGEFTCSAENLLGSQSVSVHIQVHSSPQLLGPSCSWKAQGLHCSCSSHARPAPALLWWLDQGLLLENRSNASFQVTSSSQGPWANSSLSLRDGFGTGLTVRCEARNVRGKQSAWVLPQPEPPSCSCELPEQQGSWPLVLTLIRGALMGAGYLLTYGLTWAYYSR